MPLNISEGYYHGCRFEARPVLRRRVHFHQASGVRGLWLGRNPETSQLCFGVQVHLAPHFVKTFTLLVHSFANCVMCKLLWFLDCGCSRGGAPRPSFLLHDSRSRRVPHPDQLPFFVGPFFGFGTKSSHSFGASSVLPSVPQWLMASVSWIPRSSDFWLIQRTVTGACLPSSPFRFMCTIDTTDVSVRYWAHKKTLGLAGKTQHPTPSCGTE